MEVSLAAVLVLADLFHTLVQQLSAYSFWLLVFLGGPALILSKKDSRDFSGLVSLCARVESEGLSQTLSLNTTCYQFYPNNPGQSVHEVKPPRVLEGSDAQSSHTLGFSAWLCIFPLYPRLFTPERHKTEASQLWRFLPFPKTSSSSLRIYFPQIAASPFSMFTVKTPWSSPLFLNNWYFNTYF